MRNATLLLLGLLLAASAARADDAPFGSRDQIVPYGTVSLVYSGSTAANSNGTTTLDISPGVLSFVSPNLAFGGQLSISYQSQAGVSLVTVGAAPVVGYNLWMGEKFSLFPQLTLVFGYASLSEQFASASSFVWKPAIAIPVLFHPVRHFFIGLGPSASVSVYSNGDLNTTFVLGITSVLGGYF